MPRVLIIEDNREFAYAIRYNLMQEGYSVDVAFDGTSGIESVRTTAPDLLLLDLMLPGLDGYRVLERLRGEGFNAPVLILSARGEEMDRIRGFRAGADQYLTKPFGLQELLERVKVLLLRRGGLQPIHEHGDTLRFGEIEVDLRTRCVRRDGEPVSLSPKAYELLLALYRRNGAVASRLDLLREVWHHRSRVMTRTVDSHVAELRRKLESDAGEPQHILTVRKAGYRLHI